MLSCGAELLRHGREILLLVERLAEELAQLGVNRLRIIVAQEAEARSRFPPRATRRRLSRKLASTWMSNGKRFGPSETLRGLRKARRIQRLPCR